MIGAWPSFALIGSYELLMRQIRRTATAAGPAAGRVATPIATTAAAIRAEAGTVPLPAGSRPGGRVGRRLSGGAGGAGGVPRRPAGDLLAEARLIGAEHRTQDGRPASAETLRVRLGIGSASARHLKDLVRQRPLASDIYRLAGRDSGRLATDCAEG